MSDWVIASMPVVILCLWAWGLQQKGHYRHAVQLMQSWIQRAQRAEREAAANRLDNDRLRIANGKLHETIDGMAEEVTQLRESLSAAEFEVVIETCDSGHKYAKLPDHPHKDGSPRCPHCMAKGIDVYRAALEGE